MPVVTEVTKQLLPVYATGLLAGRRKWPSTCRQTIQDPPEQVRLCKGWNGAEGRARQGSGGPNGVVTGAERRVRWPERVSGGGSTNQILPSLIHPHGSTWTFTSD